MVASIGSYFYGQAEDAIAVHLYGDSTGRFEIDSGKVVLTQQSGYPWDGAISIAVDCDKPSQFKLHLRIPGWCRAASLNVNGEPIDLKSVTKDGYATLDRAWNGGDTVKLQLDMDVRRIYANPNIRQDIGRVALARGPVLYCVEATDNAMPLHGVVLSSSSPIEAKVEPDLLRGVVSLSAQAQTDATNDWGG